MPSFALLECIGQDALVRAAEWLSVVRTIITRIIARTTIPTARTIGDIGEQARTGRSIERCAPNSSD